MAGTRSGRKYATATGCALITPHNTNELPIYAEAINASAACTADIVTIGGDTIAAYAFQAGYNPIGVKIVKNNVSGGATLWALY